MAKYRASASDTWKTLKIKALDSMPVGTIVDYDGQASDIPVGWENYGTGQIKKTSETTPTMGSITNDVNTSTKDAYSCKFINDNYAGNRVYFQGEIDTGKIWIDNKPIYRIVLSYSTPSTITNNSASIDISQLNIDTLIDCRGVATNRGLILLSDTQAITYTSSAITIYFNNSTAQSFAGHIILEYTKATN